MLASEPDRVWPAAELATRARLEPTTVAKVLKPLSHAGLVAGFRGANGGYRLARNVADVSLIAIVEAMEGPLEMTECSGEHSTCEHESHCGLPTHWRRINDVIADALGAAAFLRLELGLGEVDVNVHPAKSAVRLRGGRSPGSSVHWRSS